MSVARTPLRGSRKTSRLTGRRLLAKDLCVGTLSSDGGRDQDGGDVELHCVGLFFVSLLCGMYVRGGDGVCLFLWMRRGKGWVYERCRG